MSKKSPPYPVGSVTSVADMGDHLVITGYINKEWVPIFKVAMMPRKRVPAGRRFRPARRIREEEQ